MLDHQTHEKHPAIGRAAPDHLRKHRLHDLFQRAGRYPLGHHRRGGIGPHAARVGAGIALAHALVILRRADGQRGLAVAQNEETRLLAGHEFLDHHLGPGRAEGPAEHLVDRGQRLLLGLGHDHALAGGKPVGLDHDGRAFRLDMVARRLRVGEMRMGRRRRARRSTDLLGKALRRLEPRRCPAGPEDRDPRLAQPVRHAAGQGGLRSDDDEIHRFFLAERRHRAAVENVERGALGDLRDPGIAGCHDQAVAFGVLQHGPGQRMFAPSPAQNEDVHGTRSLGPGLRAF